MTASITERAERSFTRSFQSYHERASEQARIADLLAQRLSDLAPSKSFSSAFEIGCGTGHLTHALLRRFSIASLTVNDLVPNASRLAASLGARFLKGDIRDVVWPESPQLIASASSLQWLDAPEALLQKAATRLIPGGWLAFSSFGPAQFHELRCLGFSAQAPGLRWPEALAKAVQSTGSGLDIADLVQERRQLWFESPLDVLRHLQQTGVNAAASRVWTRTTLAHFSDRYVQAFGTPRGVPLTYHPTWMIAHKAL
ncbi:MAG: methyltransferase domain-containing protein [Rhodobacterales bacterium]|nr:methyltransferase domain-containing protein [Rhodobacterales bacterium]